MIAAGLRITSGKTSLFRLFAVRELIRYLAETKEKNDLGGYKPPSID